MTFNEGVVSPKLMRLAGRRSRRGRLAVGRRFDADHHIVHSRKSVSQRRERLLRF
jgi:hypothetical protein